MRSRARTRVLVAGVLVMVTWAALSAPAYAAKIGTPPSVAVTEGSTQDIEFRLDEPIIAPMPDPDLAVTITITVDDPSRVTLSTYSVQWLYTEWPQVRTVTITGVHDGLHNASDSVVVHYTATSGAPYYDGFSNSFTVVLTDIDPAPPTTTTTTTTPTVTTAPLTPPTSGSPTSGDPTSAGPTSSMVVAPADELPRTGTDPNATLVGGFALLAIGSAALAIARRRSSA